MVSILKRILRLYAIHIFACLAVAVSIYFPSLDVALTLLYFVVIGVEAGMYGHESWPSSILTAIIWQLPGLILSLISIAPAGTWGAANYGFFVLQFWYTPLVPVFSCLSGVTILGKPLYYYLLLAAPAIMLFYYYLLVMVSRRTRLDLTANEIIKSQRT